jgi:hypothetical protein
MTRRLTLRSTDATRAFARAAPLNSSSVWRRNNRMSRSQKDHPLDHRLDPLRQRKSRRLEGPNGEEWRLEIEAGMPPWLARCFPPDALVFANNGYGDHLFLVPDSSAVMVFWHEGHETAGYCPIDELLPNKKRPPSQHGPIGYFDTEQQVMIGDRVFIRYWLFFSGHGTVTYVPGFSPLKRELERDGLAWVRTKLDNGNLVDTIVIDGVLKKGTRLVAAATGA